MMAARKAGARGKSRNRTLRLDGLFSSTALKEAFKQKTWSSLRRSTLVDLFGYYDYNLGIDAKAERMSRAVRGGAYQRHQAIQLELTKADLLVRRMQVPHPDEAIVMTVLADAIEGRIKANQPSKRTYYGRSDHKQRGIHLFEQDRIYPWIQLWPYYQKQLLEFTRKRKMLVVTDVQNFFDSIDIQHLRTELSRICGSAEIPNFILYLFENFAVRENYAPFRGVGIPTIESDLPRLVAHCTLFRVDEYLKQGTHDSYSRWVDDINFGVSDRSQGRRMVRDVERLLFQQGLRLGGGKTRVLTMAQVSEYVQQEENQFLNVTVPAGKTRGAVARRARVDGDALVDRFIKYSEEKPFDGSTEKVRRRYYNLFSSRMEKGVIIKKPALRRIEKRSRVDFAAHLDSRFRVSIITFWLSTSMTLSKLRLLIRTALDVTCPDDVVSGAILIGLARSRLTPRLAAFLIDTILDADHMRPGLFYGMAWALAKYGNKSQITAFVSKTYPFWSANELFVRQVVALWSVLPASKQKEFLFGLLKGRSSGPQSGMIEAVRSLETLTSLTPSLRSFLPPGLKSVRFDLYRGVVSACVLRSPHLRSVDRALLISGIKATVPDPIMRRLALMGALP